MTLVIRPCQSDSEMAAFNALLANVFAISHKELERETTTLEREWTLCAFEEGRLIASSASIPVTTRLNGAAIAAGGVTAVGTLPSHRRQGVLRQLVEALLQRAHDHGETVSLLTASMGAIYQRFGYGLATTAVNYRFDPHEAAFAFDEPATGHVSFGRAADMVEAMQAIHKEYVTRGNLGVERLERFWPLWTTHDDAPDREMYAGVYLDSNRNARGYMIYALKERTHEETEGQVMLVNEFIALDVEAFRGLWEFIRKHDLVREVRTEWLATAEDDPAPLLLLEPRALHRRTLDGVWMRVVDAEAALSARPYRADGTLVVAIEGDALCPWNNGAYRLIVQEGRAGVLRTDATPDLTMRPNALATLIAGHRPATTLARAGLVGASSPTSLALADAMFATEYAPHCLEGF